MGFVWNSSLLRFSCNMINKKLTAVCTIWALWRIYYVLWKFWKCRALSSDNNQESAKCFPSASALLLRHYPFIFDDPFDHNSATNTLSLFAIPNNFLPRTSSPNASVYKPQPLQNYQERSILFQDRNTLHIMFISYPSYFVGIQTQFFPTQRRSQFYPAILSKENLSEISRYRIMPHLIFI